MENVPAIVRKYGGNYLAISKPLPNAVEVVEGTAPSPQSTVIFAFPSMEAIKNFIDGPEYAPYKKARMAATESNFFAFENDENAPQFFL